MLLSVISFPFLTTRPRLEGTALLEYMSTLRQRDVLESTVS
jgi:hypothetical protein